MQERSLALLRYTRARYYLPAFFLLIYANLYGHPVLRAEVTRHFVSSGTSVDDRGDNDGIY